MGSASIQWQRWWYILPCLICDYRLPLTQVKSSNSWRQQPWNREQNRNKLAIRGMPFFPGAKPAHFKKMFAASNETPHMTPEHVILPENGAKTTKDLQVLEFEAQLVFPEAKIYFPKINTPFEPHKEAILNSRRLTMQ